MKKFTLIKAMTLFAVFMLTVPVVFAQDNGSDRSAQNTANQMVVNIERSGRAQLAGTLVSVSGNNLTVSSWGGNWTIDATQAKLVRLYGGTSNLSEFTAGDMLQIQGTASPNAWTIIAKIVKNNSIQTKNVNIMGVVSNLNASSTQGFTLTSNEGRVYQVTLNSTGKVYVNGQIASFSDLANGITIRVQGVLDRTQKTILANRIEYNRQTANVSGTISNLNASNNSFTLTAEQRTLQVTLQINAKIVINNNTGAFSDLKNGMTVRVHGLVDKNLMTMNADGVQYRQQRINLRGTISNLNASNNSFTLTAEQGAFQVTLQTNVVIQINNGPATFADLQNGMTANVSGFGDRNLMTITASRVQARFVTATIPGTSTSTISH